MSVDYYMGCAHCYEALHIAQDGLSGFTFYSGQLDTMKLLGHFFECHSTCPLVGVRLMTEHQVEGWPKVMDSHGSMLPDD